MAESESLVNLDFLGCLLTNAPFSIFLVLVDKLEKICEENSLTE